MHAIVKELALVAVLDLSFSIFSLKFTLTAGKSIEEYASDDSSRVSICLGTLTVGLASNEVTLVLVARWPLNLAFAIWQPLFLTFRCVYTDLAGIN